MHRFTLTMLLLLIVLPLPAAAEEELAVLGATTRPAVVHLAVLDGTGQAIGNGTGFLILSTGTIVTNHHVIDNAAGILVTLADGRKLESTGILATDESRDIALIAIGGGGYSTLQLGSSAEVQEGTKVMVLGSPLGLSWTLSEGIVSAVRPAGLPEELTGPNPYRGRLLQVTAPLSPGSSGSPILTHDGKVIGVAVSVMRGAQNLNFAVPVEVVHDLIESLPANSKPRSFRTFPLKNLVISGVFFAVLLTGWFVAPWVQRRMRTRPAGLR